MRVQPQPRARLRDAAQTEIGQYQGTANGQSFGNFEEFQIGSRLGVASVDLILHPTASPRFEIHEIEFIGKLSV